ncbi:hypothetical protein ScPMuIL_018272 [Solemya velum]
MSAFDDDYRKKAEKIAETLQEYFREKEGWHVAKKTKDFTISYRASKEFDGYLYKGEALLNAPPKAVFDYVEPLPDGPRAKWDKNMKKIEICKWFTKDLRINRACTASACMGLISPRDFVDLILTKETDEYYSTNAISIDYEGCPPDKKFVRGWNWPCGMICCKIPGEPNKCKLVSLIQPSIGGMLPRTLVDSAIPGSMTELFTQLQNGLKEDGKWVS